MTKAHLHLMKTIAALVAIGAITTSTVAETEQNAQLLSKTWEAHGGLERWREQRALRYSMDGFPLSAESSRPNTSTVDLENRFNLIEGEGFLVGYNGEEAWSSPGTDSAGLPARFFALGSFYFIGMPFVFADDGVVLEDLGTSSFRGKEYKRVRARYKDGTGYTAKDDYVLYVDPASNCLYMINHSVTEPRKAVKRVTWVFNDWQKVDGLLMPKQMTFHAGWDDDDFVGEGKSFTIGAMSFSKEAPELALYERPAAGVIDNSPLY